MESWELSSRKMSVNHGRVSFVFVPFLCLVLVLALTYQNCIEKAVTPADRSFVKRNEPLKLDHIGIAIKKNSSTLLIAQYAAGGSDTYAALLNLTRPVNQAYAQMWGCDFLLVSGLWIQAELEPNTTSVVPESRATYNKVMLLHRVLTDPSYSHYDKLLILDSDALIYDFSRDVASLLPADRLFVAHKVNKSDTSSASNINIGVTLWNLRHPSALPLARRWKRACLERILNSPGLRDSDQSPLHYILKNIPSAARERMVLALPGELGYGGGTLIKHFMRPDANNWTDLGMSSRVAKIQTAVNEICERTFPPTSLNFPAGWAFVQANVETSVEEIGRAHV